MTHEVKVRGHAGDEIPATSRCRIVVTGGAGFIGSELAGQLAASGHYVLVIDNLTNGKRENLAEILGPNVALQVADLRDTDRIRPYLKGVDIVFHLACLGVRHSLHSPVENHDVNATATLRLLECSRAAGVGRFVYVSSSEVYGTACSGPMSENHPTFPTTVYGASKLAGENYTRAFHMSYNLPTVVVRPFNAFGPRCHHEGDCGEVIPKFMLRCLTGKPMIVFGDGTHTRDFTYVADTARGIMQAGFCNCAIGQTINLASGTEITIAKLAECVADACEVDRTQLVHEPPRPGDLPRLCGDATLARRLLGFSPRTSLHCGLKQLRDWYLSQDCSMEELFAQEVVHNWRKKELESATC